MKWRAWIEKEKRRTGRKLTPEATIPLRPGQTMHHQLTRLPTVLEAVSLMLFEACKIGDIARNYCV